MKKKTISIMLMFVAAVMFVMAAMRGAEKKKAASEYNAQKELMYSEVAETPEETTVPEDTDTQEAGLTMDEKLMVEGVKSLQKENPDVQGYIMILDSDIPKEELCRYAKEDRGVVLQYPVYQRKGNTQEDLDYYLHHNGKGETESYPGCIFGDGAIDAKGEYLFDLDDNGNHVIAGHNMSLHNAEENLMFAKLRYYVDKEYMAEHDNVVLVTDEAVKYYKIKYYYNGLADDDYYNVHPQSEKALSEFLSEKAGTQIETSDAITMIACDDDTSNDDYRRYVIAIQK